jgi:hypothetical protein
MPRQTECFGREDEMYRSWRGTTLKAPHARLSVPDQRFLYI